MRNLILLSVVSLFSGIIRAQVPDPTPCIEFGYENGNRVSRTYMPLCAGLSQKTPEQLADSLREVHRERSEMQSEKNAASDASASGQNTEADYIAGELVGDGLMLYPNPVSDRLFIQSGQSAITAIELQAINGVKVAVRSEVVNDRHHVLNLSGLPAGSYTVHVLHGDGKSVFQVVKL